MGTTTVAETPWAYYDPVSWALKSITYGNGASSAFDYGADQARLAAVTHLDRQLAIQAKWSYSYDSVGNLVREYDKTRPDGAGSYAFDQYTFDELNRLVAAVVQSPSYGEQLQQFDYDAFGNRISSNLMRVTSWSGAKGASTAYTTSSGLMSVEGNQVVNASFTQGRPELLQNRLPAVTAAGVPTGAVYDVQGNLTQVFEKPVSVGATVLSMTYDALGRVLSVSNTRTGLTERYQYTAEGLRVLVQDFSGSTLQKTRVNLYNDLRQLVSQYEKPAAGALTWKRDVFYVGTREAAEFDSAGMHVTQVDHLGSPRVITGPTGLQESTQKYLPFGEVLERSGAFRSAKGYTNHEQTDASGLIYMQARFYAPWFGRFASPDPARDQHFEETQSWNIYSYVRNNPVMGIDPTGMIGEGNPATAGMSGTLDHSRQMQNEKKKAQFVGAIPDKGKKADETRVEIQKAAKALGATNLAPGAKGFPRADQVKDAMTGGASISVVLGHAGHNDTPDGSRISGVAVGALTETGERPLAELPPVVDARIAIIATCDANETVKTSGTSFTGVAVVGVGKIDLKVAAMALTSTADKLKSGDPKKGAQAFVNEYRRINNGSSPGRFEILSEGGK